MTRRKVLMGNWKMYKTVDEARSFAEALGRRSQHFSNDIDFAVFAPFTCLHVLRVMLPTQVKFGAQNMHYEENGAYTGEISAGMLTEFGTQYVLVGHSERRHVFREPDAWMARKVETAFEHGLVPVLCVGETLEERESGKTREVTLSQVQTGLSKLRSEQLDKLIVAYEPVWAIGSGKTPSPDDAEAVISDIRRHLTESFGSVANEVRILYGGSVKSENIASFLSMPNIDGALVGGASLNPDSFVAMADAIKGVNAH